MNFGISLHQERFHHETRATPQFLVTVINPMAQIRLSGMRLYCPAFAIVLPPKVKRAPDGNPTLPRSLAVIFGPLRTARQPRAQEALDA